MIMRITLLAVVSSVIPCLTGCGTPSNASTSQTTSAADIDGAQFLLTEEPDGAVGVIEARESGQDGEDMVLVGRIGGASNPWIEGRAAFTLLDPSMLVVDESEGMEEGQLCTGDCCAAELKECTTLVKVVDASGELVPVDARKLLGLNESMMVVVKGKAKRDESGNFQLIATGVHVRE